MAESINDTMFLCESCLCVNVNAHAGAQPHTYTAQSVSQQGRQQAEGGHPGAHHDTYFVVYGQHLCTLLHQYPLECVERARIAILYQKDV
jgi:hypothetical protein